MLWRLAGNKPYIRPALQYVRTDFFDSENFPATITNSPEVAGIVLQRPVDAGFKIGGTGVETQKEPHDAEGRPGRGH